MQNWNETKIRIKRLAASPVRKNSHSIIQNDRFAVVENDSSQCFLKTITWQNCSQFKGLLVFLRIIYFNVGLYTAPTVPPSNICTTNFIHYKVLCVKWILHWEWVVFTKYNQYLRKIFVARGSEFFNPYFVFCTIATHRIPSQWTESNFPSQCTAARAEFHIRSQCKARGRCAALRAAPETFSRRQPVAGGDTLRRQNCQNQNRPIFKNTGTKNFHKKRKNRDENKAVSPQSVLWNRKCNWRGVFVKASAIKRQIKTDQGTEEPARS